MATAFYGTNINFVFTYGLQTRYKFAFLFNLHFVDDNTGWKSDHIIL